MVSNYVKKGVISHPVKKKYSREQLAALLYIVLSKNVLSLENIEMLLPDARAHCTAAEAYDSFCDEVENCLPFIFGASLLHPRPRPRRRRRKAAAAGHHRRGGE